MKKGSINPKMWRARIGNCAVCGKEFRAVKDFKDRKQKYCSKDCWNIRARKINKCLLCGKDVVTFNSVDKKYCNQKCRDLHYRERTKGEKSHLWLGGKTRQSKIKRTCAEYREWRMAVFTRDNFTCVKCKTKDRTIEADHIKAQSEYPELIYDVSNGRTLCHKCHKKTNNYGSKQRWKTPNT